MPLFTDQDLARILRAVNVIALVGASSHPQRPSYRVLQFLIDEGYEVYPVNPGLAGQLLLGRLVFATLGDVPVKVDMVDVFRQSQYLPEIVLQSIALGIGVLWTQLDVVHEAAIAHAEQQGMEVVADRCPAIDIPRLRRSGLL